MADLGNGRVAALRRLVLTLVFIIVFAAFAAPLTVIWISAQNLSKVQLQVTCTILETQTNTLLAIRQNGEIIRQISKDLGLPNKPPEPFVIPEIPPECEEVS